MQETHTASFKAAWSIAMSKNTRAKGPEAMMAWATNAANILECEAIDLTQLLMKFCCGNVQQRALILEASHLFARCGADRKFPVLTNYLQRVFDTAWLAKFSQEKDRDFATIYRSRI